MGMDWFEKAGAAVGGWLGARKHERQQKRSREAQMRLVDELDWEPEYASDHVPAYQKTKSPVARAWLESMLLGQNPDATWEGEANAEFTKRAQQRTQDNLYGTVAERAAESKAVQAEQPWKVTPMTRLVNPPKAQTDGIGAANNPLELPNNQVATFLTQTKGLTDPTQRNAEIARLMKQYGTMDRVVDAIRAGKV